MASDPIAEPFRWSRAETHCPFCERPLPSQSDADRHEQQGDCDPAEPHWCWTYCWAGRGGSCIWLMEDGDEAEMILRLRGEIEKLRIHLHADG
jgi:hypothetical protein